MWHAKTQHETFHPSLVFQFSSNITVLQRSLLITLSWICPTPFFLSLCLTPSFLCRMHDISKFSYLFVYYLCPPLECLIKKKVLSNMDLLSSTWNSAQCYVAAWMGGEFGWERIHLYVWLSHFAVYLKLSQLCLLIGYAPVKNKKFKINKNY